MNALFWGLAAFLGSAALAQRLIIHLGRRSLLDIPNARSNHARPVPRGGGLAICAVVVGGWALARVTGQAGVLLSPAADALLVAGFALLAAVSFIDDLRGLPALPRLLAQAAAIAAVLIAAPPLPALAAIPLAGASIAAVLWLGLVNAFNFMDGIDGISGATALVVSAAAAMILWSGGDPPILPALVAGSCLGFLLYNWRPALIFLGDVGSVPLGYVVGGMLLALAMRGEWAAALVLPAYYLVDSGLTLIRRIVARERIWEAHSQHAYQIAVRAGLAHDTVALAVASLAGVQALLATVAAERPGTALMAAYGLALAAYFALRAAPRWARRAG